VCNLKSIVASLVAGIVHTRHERFLQRIIIKVAPTVN